jgi:hypothetical protein
MPQMFGNLSIRSKLIALLAVPAAGTVLLGAAGAAAGFGDRARAAYRAGASGLGRTGDPPSTRPSPTPGPLSTASRWSGPRPTATSSLPSSPAGATTPWSTPCSR